MVELFVDIWNSIESAVIGSGMRSRIIPLAKCLNSSACAWNVAYANRLLPALTWYQIGRQTSVHKRRPNIICCNSNGRLRLCSPKHISNYSLLLLCPSIRNCRSGCLTPILQRLAFHALQRKGTLDLWCPHSVKISQRFWTDCQLGSNFTLLPVPFSSS